MSHGRGGVAICLRCIARPQPFLRGSHKEPVHLNLISSIRLAAALLLRMPESVGYRPLIVVSNREPYLHRTAEDGSIAAVPTTGGVAVALDALMRERGGTWIAHGAGDADPSVVDANDRVTRAARAPALHAAPHLAVADEEKQRYYGGFANEGLWPLCHIAHVRPIFRSGRLGRVPAVNAGSPSDRRRADRPDRRRCSSRTTTSRSSPDELRRCAPPRPDRALLAHPLAGSRPPADVSVAARDPARAARQRPARVSARARSAQFPAGVRDELRRATIERRRRVRSTAADVRSCRRRSASTSIASRRIAADPALDRDVDPPAPRAAPRRPGHRVVGVGVDGSTTRRAFPSGSTRSTGC